MVELEVKKKLTNACCQTLVNLPFLLLTFMLRLWNMLKTSRINFPIKKFSSFLCCKCHLIFNKQFKMLDIISWSVIQLWYFNFYKQFCFLKIMLSIKLNFLHFEMGRNCHCFAFMSSSSSLLFMTVLKREHACHCHVCT